MAKRVEIIVEVDDKGNLKQIHRESKKAAEGMEQVGKNSRTADRNIKGVANTSSGASKNFSKMAQGMGGLVGAYATFAASVFAISAAFEFFKRASDIQVLERSQIQFAQNSGVAMQSLTNSLREASQGMLDFENAAAASAMGLAKGFSADQMNKIAEGALKVSNVLGRNFQDSFDRLTRGISKAEPELLDELGITLRLETATKNYAAALGVSASALTTADKSQAVYLETMKQLDKVVGDAEGQANPFIQLGATFSDLAKTVSGFILPPFKALATFLNDNAAVAALFFGAIGLSIVKNMPFVDDAKQGLTAFFDSQVKKADEAKRAVEEFNKKIKEANETVAQTQAKGARKLQTSAQTAVTKGATSPVLQRAALGEMKGPDIGNLKKALKSAERQYARTGKITTGIFKDVGIKTARNIGKGLAMSEARARTTGQRIRNVFTKTGLRAKKLGATISKSLAGAFAVAGKAAKGFGKAMNMAMKATVILAVIQTIFDMVMALVNAPATILKKVFNIVKGSASFIQGFMNLMIKGINHVISKVNNIPGVKIALLEPADFAAEFGKKVDAAFDATINKIEEVTGVNLVDFEKERQNTLQLQEKLGELKSSATDAKQELATILAGSVFNKNDKEFDAFKADRARAESLKSLPIMDLMNDLEALAGDPERFADGLASVSEKLIDVKKLSPQVFKAIQAGDRDAVEELLKNAGRFTANIEGAKDKLDNLTIALKGASPEAVRLYVKEISDMGGAAVVAGNKLGLTTDVLLKLDEKFKQAGGIKEFISKLEEVADLQMRLRFEDMVNQIDTLNAGANLSGAFADKAKKDLNVQKQSIILRQKEADLMQLNNEALIEMNPVEAEAHRLKVEAKVREIALAQTQLDVAKKAADEIKQLGLSIGDSLANNFASAIDALVQGTKNAKQAFADMARSILADISKMISRMLAMQIISSLFGNTPIGNFLGVQGKTGGIMTPQGKAPGYSTGGIARGPGAGYPAILHGTEAVVPLPNGKSIPVEMKSGGQTQNNVVVNISTDGRTNTEGSTGPDMDKLGSAVAKAVQTELQNQKRSGGILNPYGVA